MTIYGNYTDFYNDVESGKTVVNNETLVTTQCDHSNINITRLYRSLFSYNSDEVVICVAVS